MNKQQITETTIANDIKFVHGGPEETYITMGTIITSYWDGGGEFQKS